MSFLVCAIVAYLWTGLSHVAQHFKPDYVERSSFGRHPTFGLFLFVLLSWPLEKAWKMSPRPARRHFAGSLVAALNQMICTTALLWLLFWGSGFLFENIWLRMLAAWIATVLVGTPLVVVIGLPITLLMTLVVSPIAALAYRPKTNATTPPRE